MILAEKYSLAKDKNTPIETLIELSKDENKEVRKLIAENPNTPIEILKELLKNDGWNVKYNLGRNPNTPIDILVTLSKDENAAVRRSVAENTNTPIETLIELSKFNGTYSFDIKRAVATNPNTPIETLIELSKFNSGSYSYEIRREVATNPNTPIETLIELSKDERYEVRQQIPRNPNTPFETLIKLSKNGNYEVRMKVAESSNTPIEILVELSKDKNYMVRREVAANPNTPIEILIELSKSGYYEVRQYVPKNPNTPQDVLITLSKDKDDDVRRNVAANPNTPIETLIELSKDKHYWVRREVATNPNTPIETLQELSKDEYNVVRRLIAENPNTPIKIIENLFINDMLPKDTKDIILNKLLNREDVNINLVNKYLKLDIKNEAKILFMLSMEKFPNEYKKNFIKEYMIKENISYMKYDSELYGGFEILTNNDNNCKVLLNDSEILTFDKLKVKNPIITTKEEAIELIKTSTYNEEYCSQTDYNDENNTLVLDIQKNASNPYKDLPEEFKNDLDVIIATLKKDSGDWTDHYSNENPYRDERATLTSYTEYKSLNIYELLPDSIKNSQEFKDKIFYEFVLPRCGTNNYFRSIIEKLYENKDSSIEIKTEICDTLTKKYNDSLPTYEDQLADIISTNYENASIYDDGYRMSESDIIDYGYHDLKATFEKQYSHSIYFDDSLKNIIKEVEDYKELSNKMKNIEEKLSNNSEALINFFKEKNIDPKSEEAKKMKQTFNETQDNLINELSEVKEKMNEYTKEKEVLEKTFNDR